MSVRLFSFFRFSKTTVCCFASNELLLCGFRKNVCNISSRASGIEMACLFGPINLTWGVHCAGCLSVDLSQ